MKKECTQLIKENEQLTTKINCVEKLYENFKRKLKEEIEKKRAIEDTLLQVSHMRDNTEVDLRKSETVSTLLACVFYYTTELNTIFLLKFSPVHKYLRIENICVLFCIN